MKEPLVSVVMRNYNYAHFLEEALDSLFAQTYSNIELILADDASTDHSLEVIERWMAEKRNRFFRFEILTTNQNLGQTLNMNRGVWATTGKYVFQFDADNTIAVDGIERLVQHCEAHPEQKFVFAKLKNHPASVLFPGCKDAEFYAGKFVDYYRLSVEEQYAKLVIFNFVSATQPFYHRDELVKVGLFDERIPNLEDYPMWLKVTNMGYKLFYLDALVGYLRVHGGSVSNYHNTMNQTGKLINEKEHEAIKQILKYYKVAALFKHGHILLLWELLNRTLYREIVIRLGNRRTATTMMLIILRYFSPIYVKQWFDTTKVNG